MALALDRSARRLELAPDDTAINHIIYEVA